MMSHDAHNPTGTSAEEHFPKVSYRRLFRFATRKEKAFLYLGIGFSILAGILTPIVNKVFGTFVQTLMDSKAQNNCMDTKKCDSPEEVRIKLNEIMINTILLVACQLVVGYAFCVCLKWVSDHQVYRTKQLFFERLLRQSIGWHDVQHHSKFISRLVQNGAKIQRATGENLGICFSLLVSSIIALGNALYHGWFLTLVSLLLMPLLVWVTYYANALETRCSEEQDLAYGDAGTVAAEALGNIKTVAAYSGELVEQERYEKELRNALSSGIRRGQAMGISDGLTLLIFYASTAFTLWLGSFLIFEYRSGNAAWGQSSPKNILTVYLNLVMAAYEFGEGISYFEMFAEGRIAAGGFHQVIDKVSEIDPLADQGQIPGEDLKGNIEIKNLHFSYPTRPTEEVLKGINISIKAGQTIAFVGHSGCGKSTMIQLLQRFYDPQRGQISFDGHDIKDLNVGWLRMQIGVVRQEPTMFSGSISDNIRLAKPSATDAEIEAVCKLANAHDFIMKFPEKYNTMLGDRGALISGGQKQRLGIARAIINNPRIVMLDEATSALDMESERSVQSALEAARRGRTMVVVAHRLSTVQSADLIVFIKDGQVLERGTHQQLYDKRGAYFQLLQTQTFDNKPHSSVSKGSLASKSDLGLSTISLVPTEGDPIKDFKGTPRPISAHKIFKIWMLNFPEWRWLFLGAIVSLFLGCVQIIHGVLFGKVIRVWGLPDTKETRTAAHMGGAMFLGLAFLSGIAALLKGVAFAMSGEKLTFRIRSGIFKAMMFQDIAWFEEKQNHLGALCTRLSEDAALAQGVTGIRMGNMIQGFTSIFISTILALYYSVKLGMVGILFLLILNILGYLEEIYLVDEAEDDLVNVENSSMLMAQAVGQIRTIASLHIEQKFIQDYTQCLENTKRVNLKPLHIRGLVMGMSQSFTWFAYIILVFYGSQLMLTEGNLTVADIVAVGQFITFGTQVVAEAMASAPNYYKAKIACGRILKLIQMTPTIKRNQGTKIPTNNIKGKLEFYRVNFAYPSRPSELIIENFSFRCEPGKHIAIIGPSGCGKSTLVKLIQRFYDPTGGFVKLDDHKFTDLDVDTVRRSIGIVSQEPVLFDRSIAENIAYGDNLRIIPMQEIIQAAKQADIHDFVDSLADGYNTRVGQLEGMLSGGQKQRVAIARSLIRKPRIFLNDESTSALDATTEEIIQHTLDSVSKGKTCITISHQPNAIRTADWVLVLDAKGKLVEQGSAAKLLKKSQFFAQFSSTTR